jgi:hypothetical protein
MRSPISFLSASSPFRQPEAGSGWSPKRPRLALRRARTKAASRAVGEAGGSAPPARRHIDPADGGTGCGAARPMIKTRIVPDTARLTQRSIGRDRCRFRRCSGPSGGVAGFSEEWTAVAFEGWSSVGWPEPGGSVGVGSDGEFPAAFMDFVMVVRAKEVEVFGFGFSVVPEPVLTVMSFGPGGWSIAAGPDAAAVPSY